MGENHKNWLIECWRGFDSRHNALSVWWWNNIMTQWVSWEKLADGRDMILWLNSLSINTADYESYDHFHSYYGLSSVEIFHSIENRSTIHKIEKETKILNRTILLKTQKIFWKIKRRYLFPKKIFISALCHLYAT